MLMNASAAKKDHKAYLYYLVCVVPCPLSLIPFRTLSLIPLWLAFIHEAWVHEASKLRWHGARGPLITERRAGRKPYKTL